MRSWPYLGASVFGAAAILVVAGACASFHSESAGSPPDSSLEPVADGGANATASLSPCSQPWLFCEDFDESTDAAAAVARFGGSNIDDPGVSSLVIADAGRSLPNGFHFGSTSGVARLVRNLTDVYTHTVIRLDVRPLEPGRTELFSVDFIKGAEGLDSLSVWLSPDNYVLQVKPQNQPEAIQTNIELEPFEWHTIELDMSADVVRLTVDQRPSTIIQGFPVPRDATTEKICVGVWRNAKDAPAVAFDVDNVTVKGDR